MTAEHTGRGQIVGRVDQEHRPEPLSDAKIGGLLAGLNKEHAGVLLIQMKPGQAYTSPQLDALIRPDGKKIWNPKAPFRLCEGSLGPISLVTKEVVDTKRGQVFGYQISEEGISLGIPLAGHLLAFSERHPQLSLQQLLGASYSPAKSHKDDDEHEMKLRSPLTRFRVISELVTGPLTIQEADLLRALNRDYPQEYVDHKKILPSISTHLENLANAGVLTFEFLKGDVDFAFYTPAKERPEGPVPVWHTQRTLTEQVEALLSEREGRISNSDMCDLLKTKNPRYQTWGGLNLKTAVSKVLTFLAENEYAEKEQDDVRTKITMSAEQQTVALEFVEIIERFRTQDAKFLTDGRRLAGEIASDPHRSKKLLEKAREASPRANFTPLAETEDRICHLLNLHPGSSNRQIHVLLREMGQHIGLPSVQAITRGLEDSGKLSTVKTKREKFYSVAEQEQQSEEEEIVLFDVQQPH